VAHTILVIVYHLIKDGMTYRELGGNYFDEREREATVRRSVRRLHRLGYKVTLEAAVPDATQRAAFSRELLRTLAFAMRSGA
jgi:hypothetical protein